MSMLGVRDLSVIETPPENRYPIKRMSWKIILGRFGKRLSEKWPRWSSLLFIQSSRYD